MNKTFRAVGRVLPKAFCILASLYLAGVLALLVFWQQPYTEYYQNLSVLSNLWLLPLAMLAIVLISALGLSLSRAPQPHSPSVRAKRRQWLWLVLWQIGLFAVQWLYARSLWFYAGWDVQTVRNTALELAAGVPLTGRDYYMLCPNNAGVTMLLAAALRAGYALGLTTPYVMGPLLSAMMVNLSCLFATLCAKRLLSRNRFAMYVSIALCTLMVGLSPYVSIPYTDSCSVLFPILALYCYLRCQKTGWKWFWVALWGSLGAAIKPTSMIVPIALAVHGACKALRALPWSAKALKHGLAAALALAIGIVPGQWLNNRAIEFFAGSPVPEEQLGMAHYLMIGLNPESMGGHSGPDLEFSRSFTTLKERNTANLQTMAERVQAMGVGGLLRLFTIKAFKAYNDGTFAWNQSLLMQEIPKRADPLSKALRSVYYQSGALNPVFQTLRQGLWLMMLLLCAIAFWLKRKESGFIPLAALTVLGASAYLLLFEVWPRYLYLYAPWFSLAAGIGLAAVMERVASYKKNHCTAKAAERAAEQE